MEAFLEYILESISGYIVIVAVAVIGEIVVRDVMKNRFRFSDGQAALVGYGFSVVCGIFMREIAKHLMGFEERYWYGNIDSYGTLEMVLYYVGLTLIIAGVIGTVFCFYKLLEQKSNSK